MNRLVSFHHQFFLGLCVAIVGAGAASAEHPWPAKTGPTADGNAPVTIMDRLPIRWDLDTGAHIDWRVDLPRGGHSTPVVGGGLVWITSATDDGRKQYVEAFDEASGARNQEILLFENESPEPLGNPVNNYAAPSPVLDGNRVYAHFGTYGTACLDAENAEIVWTRRDIHARHFRGPGSSPLIVDDLIVLTFDGIDQQFVIALDKMTGETVWRTDRSTDFQDLDADGQPRGDGDYRKAFGTPAVVRVDDQAQVVSVGARAAFGYAASTGAEVWTLRHEDYNAAAQPIALENSAIIHTGSRGAELLRLRIDETTSGDVTQSHVRWSHTRGNARLAFPVRCGELIVWVTDNGVASAVDAVSGRPAWTQRLGGNFTASPLVVGKRIYYFSRDGRAVVAEADADELRVIVENDIPSGVTASPAASNTGLFLRARHALIKFSLP